MSERRAPYTAKPKKQPEPLTIIHVYEPDIAAQVAAIKAVLAWPKRETAGAEQSAADKRA